MSHDDLSKKLTPNDSSKQSQANEPTAEEASKGKEAWQAIYLDNGSHYGLITNMRLMAEKIDRTEAKLDQQVQQNNTRWMQLIVITFSLITVLISGIFVEVVLKPNVKQNQQSTTLKGYLSHRFRKVQPPIQQ